MRTVAKILTFTLLSSSWLLCPRPAPGQMAPLEPTITLRTPEDARLHTAADVVLRPGVGFVAAWVDLNTGRAVAHVFDLPVTPVPEIFPLTLGPAQNTLRPPAVALGGDDHHLAVWENDTAAQPDLVAQAFSAEGELLGERQTISSLAGASFDLAAHPEGGFVVAWWEDPFGHASLKLQFLSPLGSPVGPQQTVVEPNATSIGNHQVRLAARSDGTIVVAWSWRGRGIGAVPPKNPSGSGARARSYGPNGVPVGEAFDLVSPERLGWPGELGLAPTIDGDFLLVHVDPAPAVEGPSSDIRVVQFDPVTGSIGATRRVATVPNEVVWTPVVATGLTGEGVVAWSYPVQTPDHSETRIAARLIHDDGTPRSEPLDLSVIPDSNFVNGLAVDRDAQGRMVFGWGTGFVPDIATPNPRDGFLDSRARRLQETASGCEAALSVGFGTEPITPTEENPVRLLFDGSAHCARVSLVDWTLEGDAFLVDAEAEPIDTVLCDVPTPIDFAIQAGTLIPGDYRVLLDVALLDGKTCPHQFDFTVQAAGSPESPPPPARPPLTSDAVPGFRIWVDITDGSGATVAGVEERPCIQETLCVSGRVPGRSEAFVRIIGPRPNGRLWPVLVKFTTSFVEVWIEQTETGEVEHYTLRGASPGFDELPGLFDREGFEP